MIRRHACRLYPTHAQATRLSMRLDAACDLYNATVRDLYRAWASREWLAELNGQGAELNGQVAVLNGQVAECPSAEHAAVASPDETAFVVDRTCLSPAVVDDVLHRAEQAFGAFVLKHQPTGDPRPPAFRAREHFVSITFPDWSPGPRGGLDLPGVGAVAVNKSRILSTGSMPVTVKHHGHIWQACFSTKA